MMVLRSGVALTMRYSVSCPSKVRVQWPTEEKLQSGGVWHPLPLPLPFYLEFVY